MQTLVLAPNKTFFGARIVQIPFLEGLRATSPEDRVAVLCPVPEAAEFVDWGLADSVTIHGRRRGLGGVTRLAAEIRRARPDTIYDLRRWSLRSSLAAAFTGAKRVGFRGPASRLLLDRQVPYDPDRPLAVRYLDLLLPRDESLARAVPLFRSWLRRRLGTDRGELPSLVLLPGAGRPEKKWPLDRFLEAGESLSSSTGLSVTVMLGPDESKEREALAGRTGVDVLDCPSLDHLLAILDSAALTISNDCGPSHLAQLTGRRFLGIHRRCWSTPEDWFLTRDNAELLLAAEEGMDGVPTRDVVEAALRLLEKPELACEVRPHSGPRIPRARV